MNKNRNEYGVLQVMSGLTIGLSVLAGSAMADGMTWNTGEGGNGHRYEVVVPPGGITWTDARDAAEAAGGHLATLTSQAEFDFVESLEHPTKGWVGGYRTGSDWYWVTGESFEAAQWCGGQPGSGGDYLQLAYGCFIADGNTPDEGEFYVIEFGDATQWRTEDGGNGHWYMHHSFDEATHVLDAQAWAQSHGGYVSSVRSHEENNWIWNTFGNSTLGGYQDFDAPDFSEPGGGWRWANGEPWDYTNWLPGEPSNSNGNEHGVAVCCPPHLEWNDVQLYNVTYLIEIDADCNGDNIVDYGQILDGTLEDDNGNGVPDECETPGVITVCASGCDFTEIQPAIDASISGDIIEIGSGLYTGTGDAVATLPGHDITLLGMSFNEDGTPIAIVDGQGVRRGILLPHAGNEHHVVSGLLVRNGYVSQGNGGGALATGGSPQFINCHFVDNAVTGISGPGNGAGVYCSSGNPGFTDCVFRNNSAQRWGGGLGLFGVSGATLDSCVFESCGADNGGAMFTEQGAIVLVGCVIEDNTASDDVGGVYQEGGSITVHDCTFTGNTSGDDGGGLYASNANVEVSGSSFIANVVPEDGAGMDIRDSQLQISNSFFDDNSASQGAGLMAVRSTVDIRDCEFTANLALTSSSNEEMAGGAIEFHSCQTMFVSGCEFVDNEARDGGALCLQNPFDIWQPAFIIEQCLFDSNLVDGKGGAIYIGSNFGSVDACEFLNNNAEIMGNAIFMADAGEGGGVYLEYGNSLFCGSGSSPVETSAPSALVDGGGNVIEANCEACNADLNEDGIVTVNDLLIVIAQWNTEGPLGDVDGDGVVNVQDLLLVIQAWDTCG